MYCLPGLYSSTGYIDYTTKCFKIFISKNLKKKKLPHCMKDYAPPPLHTSMTSLKTNLRNWLLPVLLFHILWESIVYLCKQVRKLSKSSSFLTHFCPYLKDLLPKDFPEIIISVYQKIPRKRRPKGFVLRGYTKTSNQKCSNQMKENIHVQ